MLLGKVLKHIRVFHHHNQVELAEILHVSRSYISEIEADKKIPTIEFLQKYSEVFDIPLSNIMMFVESEDLKKSAKSKTKTFLTNTAVKFLDWIAKDDDKKEE